MAGNSKENGLQITWKATDSTHGMMEGLIKASMLRIRSMATESIYG